MVNAALAENKTAYLPKRAKLPQFHGIAFPIFVGWPSRFPYDSKLWIFY